MLNYDEMYDELEKTQKLLTHEIMKINEKNDLTPGELNNLKEAVCVMKDIIRLDQMIDEALDDGYKDEDGYSEYGRSMRRGRSATTGRYVSREPGHHDMRGMSRHSLHDRMAAKLESMMDSAGSDYERQKIGEWIDKIKAAPENA